MDKVTLKETFVLFLIENGALFQYTDNLNAQKRRSLDSLIRVVVRETKQKSLIRCTFNSQSGLQYVNENLLAYSFKFSETKEGHMYWWRLHYKWERYYTKKNGNVKMKTWTTQHKKSKNNNKK